MMCDLDSDGRELDYVNLDDLFDAAGESDLFGDLEDDKALQRATGAITTSATSDPIFGGRSSALLDPNTLTSPASSKLVTSTNNSDNPQKSQLQTNASKNGGKNQQGGETKGARRRKSKVKNHKGAIADIRSEVSIRGLTPFETKQNEIQLVPDYQEKLFFPFAPLPDDILASKLNEQFSFLEGFFKKSPSM
jgi:hypothetical protein